MTKSVDGITQQSMNSIMLIIVIINIGTATQSS